MILSLRCLPTCVGGHDRAARRDALLLDLSRRIPPAG